MIYDRYSTTNPIHKANEGMTSARDTGLNLAKIGYVMILDSDDILLPDLLEMIFEHIESEDIAVDEYTIYIEDTLGWEVMPSKSMTFKGEV